MDRDSRPNSLPDLSERALRAARCAVFLSCGVAVRGTRIIAVFYAVALWMASAFVAVILSMFAIAVGGDSGLFHP